MELERFVREIEEGKAPRLILAMPPRTGKSEIASDKLPSWILGKHPDWDVIASSYAVSLPIGFSRNIRDRLKDKLYQNIFPDTRLDPSSQAAETWKTTKGGTYTAAGVGGGITGKGAHALIIDDPVKDAEEADSETIRAKIIDWYGSTAYTRLAPGGGVLIIMTRWHDDDLAGHVVLDMEAKIKEGIPKDQIDIWRIVCYEGIASKDEYLDKNTGDVVNTPGPDHKLLRRAGEALHPERFSLAELIKKKNTLQPRHWSALYQQKPQPDEGTYFTKSMFSHRPLASFPPPELLRIGIAGDLAIGTKDKHDRSVFAVGGLDYEDTLHILRVLVMRGNIDEQAKAFIKLLFKYKPYICGFERGQLNLALRPIVDKRLKKINLKRKQQQKPAFYPNWSEKLSPINDKLTRARPLQGRMQMGNVIVPLESEEEWVGEAKNELMRFPTGVFDDIVDGCAWLEHLLKDVPPPQKAKQKKPGKSWRDELRKFTSGSAKNHMSA